MAYPPVVIVDENDKVIGSRMLGVAWEKGLRHRVVYVLVEDSQGRVLLHQRARHLLIDPGRWDTVAGHVDVTPDYKESAIIELREEGGIENEPLEEVAYFYRETPYHNGTRARRFIKVFRLCYDGPLGTPDHEVAATRWFTKEELKRLASDHPEQIAIGPEICLPYILGEGDVPGGASPALAAAAS